MKKAASIIVLTFLIAASQAPFALSQGTPAERRVVYLLAPGEELLIPESTLCLSLDADHVTLVVAKGKEGPFFVILDGVKKGPFAKLAETMKIAEEAKCDKPLKGNGCAVYSPAPEAVDMESIVGADESGGQIIKFGGKVFGPFTMILNVKITADKSRLYYIAMEKEKTWFACTDGRKVQVGGMPEDFKISPDGRNALLKMTGTLGMDEMQKLAQQSPEKVAAAMKDMDKKFLYAIDGRKFGPFENVGEYWFPATSNAFYYEVGDKVFCDGVAIAVPEQFSPCAYYPSEDGKRRVLYTYEYLLFGDGTKYPFPFGLIVYARGGRTMLKWAALENKKDLVVYQKPL